MRAMEVDGETTADVLFASSLALLKRFNRLMIAGDGEGEGKEESFRSKE